MEPSKLFKFWPAILAGTLIAAGNYFRFGIVGVFYTLGLTVLVCIGLEIISYLPEVETEDWYTENGFIKIEEQLIQRNQIKQVSKKQNEIAVVFIDGETTVFNLELWDKFLEQM